MQVFSEMAYERPDMEETLRFIEDSARKAAGADSYEKAREIFLALLEKLRHVSTMETIASIRNTADMTDVFYEKEMEYFHAGGQSQAGDRPGGVLQSSAGISVPAGFSERIRGDLF